MNQDQWVEEQLSCVRWAMINDYLLEKLKELKGPTPMDVKMMLTALIIETQLDARIDKNRRILDIISELGRETDQQPPAE